MKQVKAKAIPYEHFYKGKPPKTPVSLLDSLAESILSATGLKKHARAKLKANLFEAQSDSYVQKLQAMCNDIVDGGIKGLATALKVCFCLKK